MVVDRNGADHIPAFEVELVDQTPAEAMSSPGLWRHITLSKTMSEKQPNSHRLRGRLPAQNSVQLRPCLQKTKSFSCFKKKTSTCCEAARKPDQLINSVLHRLFCRYTDLDNLSNPPEMSEINASLVI